MKIIPEDKLFNDVPHCATVHAQSHEAVVRLLANGKVDCGVEIGVQYGQNAEAILATHPTQALYGIDCYQTAVGTITPLNDPARDNEVYGFALGKLDRFGDRYTHIKKRSNEALVDVPGLIDFIYIDGDPSRKQLYDDISYWFPKVRTGGIMIGHGYGHSSYRHIAPLVDNYFGLTPQLDNEGVWWVKKDRLFKPERKISVVTPFYNTGYWARWVFEVAIADPRIEEIIIVDDESVPGETEMLKTVIQDVPKIRYVRNDQNQGELKSRVRGAELAKNNWLIFLDGDNSLTPEYLDAIYAIPDWRSDVIYHPSFGNKKHINYESLVGQYFNQSKMAEYINTSPYLISMFLNTGNYFMNKDSYLEAARECLEIPKHSYGDIVVNSRWLRAGMFIFVVEGMHYVHRTRKESAWKDHATEMEAQIKIELEALGCV